MHTYLLQELQQQSSVIIDELSQHIIVADSVLVGDHPQVQVIRDLLQKTLERLQLHSDETPLDTYLESFSIIATHIADLIAEEITEEEKVTFTVFQAYIRQILALLY